MTVARGRGRAAVFTQATFETASCDAVRKEMNARVSGDDGWRDPHNGGTYTLKTSDADGLAASRTTANGQYTDQMAFAFAEKGGGCVVTGCSTSQVTSAAARNQTVRT